jgi:hypothetical protein
MTREELLPQLGEFAGRLNIYQTDVENRIALSRGTC